MVNWLNIAVSINFKLIAKTTSTVTFFTYSSTITVATITIDATDKDDSVFPLVSSLQESNCATYTITATDMTGNATVVDFVIYLFEPGEEIGAN